MVTRCIKGNHYRIVCAMDYKKQAMFIKFVGTHSEYNKIDVEVIE
ncbi:MAG: type II toxin-antitoxin system HigB family toxin [Desulfobacteraceae bacterium]|jgi:mRNA interferase HigB